MKFIKSLISHLVFFTLGLFAAAVLSFTALSYFTIDQLSKAFQETPAPVTSPSVWDQPLNPNLKEVILIGATYIKELDLFDQLEAEINKTDSPEICSVLCNPIGLDSEALAAQKIQFLVNYYQQNKLAALKDPLFRLRMQEVAFLSQLFPPSFRIILKEVQSSPVKWSLVLQLQWALFKEMTTMVYRWETMKTQLKNMEKQRVLFQSCRTGSAPKKVLQDCQSH